MFILTLLTDTNGLHTSCICICHYCYEFAIRNSLYRLGFKFILTFCVGRKTKQGLSMKKRLKRVEIASRAKKQTAFKTDGKYVLTFHKGNTETVSMDTDYYAPMRDSGSRWQQAGNYKGARVMPCTGSGPEQRRDTRHPDLKTKPKPNRTGGFEGKIVRRINPDVVGNGVNINTKKNKATK